MLQSGYTQHWQDANIGTETKSPECRRGSILVLAPRQRPTMSAPRQRFLTQLDQHIDDKQQDQRLQHGRKS